MTYYIPQLLRHSAGKSGGGVKVQLTRGQLAAVVAGNAFEFYDFLIFGFFAIQIGQVFFPDDSATAGLLKTLAVFGAGFLTRPLGGLVLGRMGDRIGRKPVMLFTFGLMGVSIAGLALTPSYASIGVAAPALALLFRLLQGFALGGEVGPTTAYLLEAAPLRQRGRYVSLQNATQYFAVLCVGIVSTLMGTLLPQEAFGQWGWRAAMLLGAAVIPFAYLMRRRLPETLHATAAEEVAAQPPLRLALLALLMIAATTISTYCMNYVATYVQHTLGVSAMLASVCTIICGLCAMSGALIGGRLSDHIGRKTVLLLGGVGLMVLGVPCFFAMLLSPTGPVLAAAAGLMSFFVGLFPPAVLTNIAESYPVMLRARSLGFLYAFTVAVFGGTSQYIVTWLIDATGSPLAPAWYMTGAMAIGVVGMALTHETAPVKTSH
jgi:MHS family citrate/tricarballylate:H+ symporter-like MFS transporter